MNDDLRFDPDPLDDELRRRFAAGTRPDADPDLVLDTMRPRLRQARTRRRASIAGALGGLAALVVVVLLAVGGGGGAGSVRTPPASRGPLHTVGPTPSTAPADGSVTPDTAVGGSGDNGAPGDEPAATAPDTSPAANGPTPTEPPTAPSPPANPDQEFTSPGGSIVVHLADGVVSLVTSTPAAGYVPQVHDNGPTRVEVRFTNGTTEWRVRVDVVDGALKPEISQH